MSFAWYTIPGKIKGFTNKTAHLRNGNGKFDQETENSPSI